MAEANLQAFYRTFLWVSFLLFVVSLETVAEQSRFDADGKNGQGSSPYEWTESAKGKATKRVFHISKASYSVLKKAPGYLYIIKAYQKPYFKIGFSDNPAERVKQLQTGSMYPLKLAVEYKVENKLEAEKEALEAMSYCSREKDYPELEDWSTEWCNLPPGGLEEVDDKVTKAISEYLESKTPHDWSKI